MSNIKNDIVLNFHDSLLRQSDLNLLMGPYWLNDQIISFYFEYLERIIFNNENRLLFISPEVTQCIKIVPETEINIFLDPLKANEKLFIFFALNNNEADSVGGTHWSLLIFSRPENKFYHYDSMNSFNLLNCQHLIKVLKKALNCVEADFENVKCLQQTNGYDCGIHVICNVDVVSNHAVKHLKVQGARQLKNSIIKWKREEILDVIRDLGGQTFEL